MLPVETPFKTYTDLNGKPLDQGFVYFGQPNQNPITAPVTVYWDAAGTMPASQPLRTTNGYIMRAGTPANVFFDGVYSELVQDKKKQQVFYARTSDEFSIASIVQNFISNLASSVGAALIGWANGGTKITLQKALDILYLGSANVRNPRYAGGAAGDGVTDDSAAIQAAVNGGGKVIVPPGNYLVKTGISLPSVVEVEFMAGATLLAGSDNMYVLYTKGGLKSSVKLRNPSVSGNGKNNVTGIRYQNVQFDSFIEHADVVLCATGIVLSNTCIGVEIIKPTTYRTANAIQVMSSNANTITTPNLDNTASSGGTGTGTGIFFGSGGIAAPSTNQVYGGFIQGFDYGIYDQGYASGVDGVYLEQCNTAAFYANGAVSGVVSNIEFFGDAGTNYAVQMIGCQGMQILFPKHVKFGGAGALFNVNTSNQNCVQISNKDGGTSNTALGDISGLRAIALQTNPATFTPRIEGTTSSGACTYATQRGNYQIIGGRCHFSINVAWSGHTGSGSIIIPGLPVGAADTYGDENFAVIPSGFAFTGIVMRAYLSSPVPFIQIVQVQATGSAAALPLPFSGALNISGSYLVA